MELYENDLVYLKIQIWDRLSANFTFIAFNDLEMKNERYRKVIEISPEKVVGKCTHGQGEGIVINTYTSEEGDVRITCSDPYFDQPGCNQTVDKTTRVYHLDVLAYNGRDVNELGEITGGWKDLASVYKTFKENDTTEWTLSQDTKPECIKVYDHQWYKQLSYNLKASEIEKILSKDNPILVARCGKSINKLGKEVRDFHMLKKASAIYNYNRRMKERESQTTTTQAGSIETARPSNTTPSPNDIEFNKMKELMLYGIIAGLSAVILIMFVFWVCLLHYERSQKRLHEEIQPRTSVNYCDYHVYF